MTRQFAVVARLRSTKFGKVHSAAQLVPRDERTPSRFSTVKEGAFLETDHNTPTDTRRPFAFIEHRHYRSFGRLPLGAVLKWFLSVGMHRGRKEMRRGGKAGSETIMYMQCCRREGGSRNIIALFRPDAPWRKGGWWNKYSQGTGWMGNEGFGRCTEECAKLTQLPRCRVGLFRGPTF